MGLLDAPAPMFSWLDAQLGPVMPPLARLLVWGTLAGLGSMLLYRALSAQARIARGKREVRAARRALDVYDGPLDDAWPLIRRLLRLAVSQVGRTGWPALVASLPVLCLLAWLSNVYGHGYPPPGSSPRIATAPMQLDAQWLDGTAPRIRILDGARIVADVVLEQPTPLIHKRQWWNVLLGNPAGYLPADAAVERVRIDLPAKQYLQMGPGWLRGWAPSFLCALLAASLTAKVAARIE